MHPGRSAVQPPRRFRRRHAHASEKRVQGNFYTRREVGNHLFAIERNDLRAAVRIIIGQKPTASSKPVARKWHIDIDLQYLHFEHIAWLCLGNLHGPGKNVAARSLVFHFPIDIRVISRYVRSRDSFAYQPLSRSAGRERLNVNRVAGVNRDHRFGLGRVISPNYCSGRGCQCYRRRLPRSQSTAHEWRYQYDPKLQARPPIRSHRYRISDCIAGFPRA